MPYFSLYNHLNKKNKTLKFYLEIQQVGDEYNKASIQFSVEISKEVE